jgi:CBS domain containing-hemolysin-like protein
MVPRTELVAVDADTPDDVALQRITASDARRLLVFRTNLDNIVGILHSQDVLRALVSGNPINPSTLAREALTLPETLAADEVLAVMRRKGVQEAVVIDEYGGTAGLVTFESLMERIVGDVGAGGGRIRIRPDGSADIDGLALVTDVNEQFDLDIDEDVFTTVGGYVLRRLGRRARVGDAIDVSGRRMRVDAVDGLRVAKVWLSTPDGAPSA